MSHRSKRPTDMVSSVQKGREQGKVEPLHKDKFTSEVQRSLQGWDVLNVAHDQFWMFLEQNI